MTATFVGSEGVVVLAHVVAVLPVRQGHSKWLFEVQLLAGDFSFYYPSEACALAAHNNLLTTLEAFYGLQNTTA